MTRMLVKNVVEDFDRWRRVFDAQREPARVAGLETLHIWRDADRPHIAYVLFSVADRRRADAFVHDPASAKVGEDAGVLGGELTYLEHVD